MKTLIRTLVAIYVLKKETRWMLEEEDRFLESEKGGRKIVAVVF